MQVWSIGSHSSHSALIFPYPDNICRYRSHFNGRCKSGKRDNPSEKGYSKDSG